MSLIWPRLLILLGLIPLLIAVYVLFLRRRRRFAVRYSSLALVREAIPRHSRWRRHLPFAIFLLALASLALAMARAAVAVGADGLIIEVHPQTELALSDGFQSLHPDEFEALMEQITAIAGVVGRTTTRSAPSPSAAIRE